MGATPDTLFGSTVNTAGDVNGDGIDDVIIGDWTASALGRGSAGIAYVIYGSSKGFPNIDLANNLTTTKGFTIVGAMAGDSFGTSVGSPGDINGDGIDEILIGAAGVRVDGNYSGSAYILFVPINEINSTST